MLTASIVTYRNSSAILSKTIESYLAATPDSRLYVVDNSPNDRARAFCEHPDVEYIFNNSNVGFGRGHNQIIKNIIGKSKYHLVLNPDVYFDKHVITELINFMESNPNIGLVMPKVLYPDGRLQPLCKLLPQPHEIIVRRFFCRFKNLYSRINYHYEMQFTGYDGITEVPFLSGCFMLIRTEVLQKVGLFDERFFLYFEDTDLSRRIHQHFQTLYYPRVEVFHYHESGLNKKKKNLWLGLKSAIQYFNKWGWFNDPAREAINRKILIHHRVNGYSKQTRH